MKARYFLLTDPKIEEAVSNGYDIRLSEEERIAKMELYADTKAEESGKRRAAMSLDQSPALAQ